MSPRATFGISLVILILALFGPWGMLSKPQVDTGTVSHPANATSTVVTHALGFTPPRVLLSPQGEHAFSWWVESKAATSFVIRTSATSTTATVFDWRASEDE